MKKSKWVLIIGAGFVLTMAVGVLAQRRCASHPGCPLLRMLKPNPVSLNYASADANDQNAANFTYRNADYNTPRSK